MARVRAVVLARAWVGLRDREVIIKTLGPPPPRVYNRVPWKKIHAYHGRVPILHLVRVCVRVYVYA